MESEQVLNFINFLLSFTSIFLIIGCIIVCVYKKAKAEDEEKKRKEQLKQESETRKVNFINNLKRNKIVPLVIQV